MHLLCLTLRFQLSPGKDDPCVAFRVKLEAAMRVPETLQPIEVPFFLNSGAAFPSRKQPPLVRTARPRLRVTRSEIAIYEFGRHRHHDQSKNPAHHTTGSKLAPPRAVLKFNLDAILRSTMQTEGVSPDDIGGCSLSSLTASAVLARSLFPSSARSFCSPSCAAATKSHVTIVTSSPTMNPDPVAV